MIPILIHTHDAPELAGMVALFTVILGMITFFSLVVCAVICFLVSSSLARVPAAHRKMEPGMVWLLMIPCFGLVWNFFVFQRVPDSFKGYFESVGRRDLGDCGKGMGLAYSITVVACLIPLLNYIAGPASLVLLILCLVKFHELKNQIPAALLPG